MPSAPSLEARIARVRLAALAACVAACLSACSGSDASSPEGGERDAGRGGANVSVDGGCVPMPARCDGFGDERPARLSEHTAVYDPERLEMIVFGGTGTVPEACAFGGAVVYESATWIYDDPCNAWLRVEGTGPTASGRHMAAFGDGSVWLFGGRYRAPEETGPYTLYADLYRFDVAARRWQVGEVDGERPPARASGALVWDSRRARLLSFGGNASGDGASYAPLDDLWSYDPSSGRFERLAPAGEGPAARLSHAALYDAGRDALIVYGGADERAFALDASYFGDLWSLSLSELRWTRLHAGGVGAPEGRFAPALAHDTGADAYLLFGGHDDQLLGNRNDAWAFDPSTARWQRAAEGDTFHAAARGTCDFPPDFAVADLALPERRSAHSLVYSPRCDHALVFGGKTDCGAIDDVWRWRASTFDERLAATEGEACLRWRDEPERCADMCF